MSRIKRFQPIIDSMILPAIESARSVHSLSELSGVYAFVTSQVARIHAILKQLIASSGGSISSESQTSGAINSDLNLHPWMLLTP